MRQVLDKRNGKCYTIDFSRMLLARGIGISPGSIKLMKVVGSILCVQHESYLHNTGEEGWIPLPNQYQEIYKNYLADKELLGE